MTERIIGQYRIEKKLGEGGVGEVFQAVDPVLGRPVAIKRLRPELASREQIVARFKSEARTLAKLNHPNIATLYSFEQDRESLLMVMEYVEGETLSTLLRRDGAFPLERALPLIVQALDGIGYAHAHGVVHRDIKGPNLMLRSDGVLKVMDFGIARVIGSERVTQLGQLVGTPEFMSPEQIQGDETDARSDLYSLGILCWALLVGRVPFASKSGFDLMKAQIESSPPRLSEAAPNPLPARLDDVLERALAKNPADRFATAEEFRAEIEPFLSRRSRDQEAGGPAPRKDGEAARSQAPPTRELTAHDEDTQNLDRQPERPTVVISEHEAQASPASAGPHATAQEGSEPDEDAPTRVQQRPTLSGQMTPEPLGDMASEKMPRTHQTAWILAPSLLAVLGMGLAAIWTELSSEPPEERPGPAAAAIAQAPLQPETSAAESPFPLSSSPVLDGAEPALIAIAGQETAETGPAQQAGEEPSPVAEKAAPRPTSSSKKKAPSAPVVASKPKPKPKRRAAPPAKPAPTPKPKPAEEETGWVIRR